jgi:hypothetical protein
MSSTFNNKTLLITGGTGYQCPSWDHLIKELKYAQY